MPSPQLAAGQCTRPSVARPLTAASLEDRDARKDKEAGTEQTPTDLQWARYVGERQHQATVTETPWPSTRATSRCSLREGGQ